MVARCALEPALLAAPVYEGRMAASMRGVAFSFPGSPEARLHCQLRFCDKMTADCEVVSGRGWC